MHIPGSSDVTVVSTVVTGPVVGVVVVVVLVRVVVFVVVVVVGDTLGVPYIVVVDAQTGHWLLYPSLYTWHAQHS